MISRCKSLGSKIETLAEPRTLLSVDKPQVPRSSLALDIYRLFDRFYPLGSPRVRERRKVSSTSCALHIPSWGAGSQKWHPQTLTASFPPTSLSSSPSRMATRWGLLLRKWSLPMLFLIDAIGPLSHHQNCRIRCNVPFHVRTSDKSHFPPKWSSCQANCLNDWPCLAISVSDHLQRYAWSTFLSGDTYHLHSFFKLQKSPPARKVAIVTCMDARQVAFTLPCSKWWNVSSSRIHKWHACSSIKWKWASQASTQPLHKQLLIGLALQVPRWVSPRSGYRRCTCHPQCRYTRSEFTEASIEIPIAFVSHASCWESGYGSENSCVFRWPCLWWCTEVPGNLWAPPGDQRDLCHVSCHPRYLLLAVKRVSYRKLTAHSSPEMRCGTCIACVEVTSYLASCGEDDIKTIACGRP